MRSLILDIPLSLSPNALLTVLYSGKFSYGQPLVISVEVEESERKAELIYKKSPLDKSVPLPFS